MPLGEINTLMPMGTFDALAFRRTLISWKPTTIAGGHNQLVELGTTPGVSCWEPAGWSGASVTSSWLIQYWWHVLRVGDGRISGSNRDAND